MALPDIEWPLGEVIRAIKIAPEDEHLSLGLRVSRIEFHFAAGTIGVGIDTDTDEIVLDMLSVDGLSDCPSPLNKLIGHRLVYVWQPINSQGYSDVLLLGVRFAHPCVGIVAEASLLKVFQCVYQ